MNKLYVLFLMCIVITSCTPVIQTFYTYTPPESFEGKKCVNDCMPIKQQCESNLIVEQQSCLNRAQSALHLCEARKVYRYNYKKGRTECVQNCYCSAPSCPNPDTTLCDQRYNRCYENCGGEVMPYQKCVANCEEYNQQ